LVVAIVASLTLGGSVAYGDGPPDEHKYDADFQTDDQSVFGPGPKANPTGLQITELFGFSSWNSAATSGGSIATNSVDLPKFLNDFGIPDFDFPVGLQYNTDSDGLIDIAAIFSNFKDPGIDINYPVDVTLLVDQADSFKPGEIVTVQTGWTIDPNWDFSTKIPTFDVDVAGLTKLFWGLDVHFCAIACDDFNITVDIQDGSGGPQRKTIMQNSMNGKTTLPLFSSLKTGVWGSFGFDPTAGMVVTLEPDGETITYQSSAHFIDIAMDYDKFLGTKVLGVDRLPIPGADIGYIIFDSDLNFDRYMHTVMEFSPSIQGTFNFPQAVSYVERIPNGPIVSSGQSTLITFEV